MSILISGMDLTSLGIGLIGVAISLAGILLLRPADATTPGVSRAGTDGEGLGNSS